MDPNSPQPTDARTFIATARAMSGLRLRSSDSPAVRRIECLESLWTPMISTRLRESDEPNNRARRYFERRQYSSEFGCYVHGAAIRPDGSFNLEHGIFADRTVFRDDHRPSEWLNERIHSATMLSLCAQTPSICKLFLFSVSCRFAICFVNQSGRCCSTRPCTKWVIATRNRRAVLFCCCPHRGATRMCVRYAVGRHLAMLRRSARARWISCRESSARRPSFTIDRWRRRMICRRSSCASAVH